MFWDFLYQGGSTERLFVANYDVLYSKTIKKEVEAVGGQAN
jgi:hypothetical protein